MSTVEAWSFAAPLKFLIRKLRCFFREGKKKEGGKSVRFRVTSFHPFRSRLPVVSLNDEASLGLLRLLNLVQLFTTPPYPSARPERNSGSSPSSQALSVGYSPNDIARIEGAFLVLLLVKPLLYDITIDYLFPRGMLPPKFLSENI